MANPHEDYEPKDQPDSGWIYVAPVNVTYSEGRVTIPDGLFEAEILEERGDAHWAYEKVSGIPIVSNKELEDPEYHTVGERKIYPDNQSAVPAPFFPPGEDVGPNEWAKTVDENALIRREERRHFIYQVGMDEGDTRSCYLLTDEQLQARLNGPEDWVGNFDSIPKFF